MESIPTQGDRLSHGKTIATGEGKPNLVSHYGIKSQGVGKDKLGFSSEIKSRPNDEEEHKTAETKHMPNEEEVHKTAETKRMPNIQDEHKNVVEIKDMSMDDSITNSPKRLKNPDATAEAEVKNAINEMNETAQVIDIVNNIEKNNYESKLKLNSFDVTNLECDVTAQTLSQCYSIVYGILHTENPNFDEDKMEFQLTEARNKVRVTSSDYNKFKGEFFAVNEPVLNRDPMNFKLDRVQRCLGKQDHLLQNLLSLEKQVTENQESLIQLKKAYEDFEKNLFEKKIKETKKIIVDTH